MSLWPRFLCRYDRLQTDLATIKARRHVLRSRDSSSRHDHLATTHVTRHLTRHVTRHATGGAPPSRKTGPLRWTSCGARATLGHDSSSITAGRRPTLEASRVVPSTRSPYGSPGLLDMAALRLQGGESGAGHAVGSVFLHAFVVSYISPDESNHELGQFFFVYLFSL